MSKQVNSPNRNYSKKPYGSTQFVAYTDTQTGRKKTYQVDRGIAPPASGIIAVIFALLTCGFLIAIGLFPIAIILIVISILKLVKK